MLGMPGLWAGSEVQADKCSGCVQGAGEAPLCQDVQCLAGHVLTLGRACLSFEREVLADEYPEKDPSTGKLIRDAIAEDVSAHKVCLCCALTLSQLGRTAYTTTCWGQHRPDNHCRACTIARLQAGLHGTITEQQASAASAVGQTTEQSQAKSDACMSCAGAEQQWCARDTERLCRNQLWYALPVFPYSLFRLWPAAGSVPSCCKQIFAAWCEIGAAVQLRGAAAAPADP